MLNLFKKRKFDIRYNALCAVFVNWLLDHHYEEIAPLLNEWKESSDA